MKLSLIVAVSDNGVIGNKGKIPWDIQKDMEWFREITIHKPIIMGRRTFESLRKPLTDRFNIVVTSDIINAMIVHVNQFDNDKTLYFNQSIDSAIKTASRYMKKNLINECVIIGGAEIYKQTLSLVDRVYLTQIHKNYEGDAFFLLQEIVENDHFEMIGINKNKGSPDFDIMVFDRINDS